MSDAKKEDFKRYLEKNGVVDALTNVLVALYEEPEKPESALEYVRNFIAGVGESDAMKAEIADLRRQIAELTARLQE